MNPETGKFDPPFGPPEELQIELLQIINWHQYGVRVVKKESKA